MELKTVQFSPQSPKYCAPTWDQLDLLTFQMAQKIRQDQRQIDRVVTLAKGGWPFARCMVDYLSITQVASIGVRFYSDLHQRLKKPEIYQDVPVSVAGEHILIFDDIADSGESLAYVKQYLEYKNTASITTATLFYKSHSQLTPDYYGAHTDAWVVFPFEKMETAKHLVPKWKEQGVGEVEILQRLQKLGISEDVSRM